MIDLTNCTIERWKGYRKGHIRGVFLTFDGPFAAELHTYITAMCGRRPDNHEIYRLTPQCLNEPTAVAMAPLYFFFTDGTVQVGTHVLD